MPTAVGITARSTVRSSKKQTLFSSKLETNVSGMERYRKTLEIEGILSNAAKLISQSRRPGSIVSCKLPWLSELAVTLRKKLMHFVPL